MRARTSTLGGAALALALSSMAAQAAVLDFGTGPTVPNYCSNSVDGSGAMLSCADWSYFNQGYGDSAALDLSYSHPGLVNTSLRWWASNYNDLYGVLWADGGDGPASHARIELKPLGGGSVTLSGFDLGAYSNATRGTIVDVYEIGSAVSLFHYEGPVGVGSTTHASFAMDITSSTGLWVEFKNTAYNVGIDNIAYSVTAVPEPESLALMLTGLVAVGAAARRRRSN